MSQLPCLCSKFLYLRLGPCIYSCFISSCSIHLLDCQSLLFMPWMLFCLLLNWLFTASVRSGLAFKETRAVRIIMANLHPALVVAPVLCTLYTWAHLSFITIPWDPYYNRHLFTGGEASIGPSVLWVGNDRAGMLVSVFLLPELMFLTTAPHRYGEGKAKQIILVQYLRL